jgi:hypothetical protein
VKLPSIGAKFCNELFTKMYEEQTVVGCTGQKRKSRFSRKKLRETFVLLLTQGRFGKWPSHYKE